jgi:AcrR family transcriptional regulator
LFYEKGYDAVGVQEIVDTAGITKPTMYYYFKSKQGLLECLLEEQGNKMLARIHDALQMEGEFSQVLKAFVQSYVQIALENKEFYLMLVSLLFSSARDNEAFKAAQPYISRLFYMLEAFFGRFAEEHTGLRGREEYCSISFTGIINTYMLVAFERGTIDEMLGNQEIIDFMVKQFTIME